MVVGLQHVIPKNLSAEVKISDFGCFSFAVSSTVRPIQEPS